MSSKSFNLPLIPGATIDDMFLVRSRYVAVSVFGKHLKRTSVLDEGGSDCAWGASGQHFRWDEGEFQ